MVELEVIFESELKSKWSQVYFKLPLLKFFFKSDKWVQKAWE